MRRAALLLVMALLAPAAWAEPASHVADASNDVVRVAGQDRAPAELPGADVLFVGVTRTANDGRVTVGYGGAIPVDVELLVVLQLGPRPEHVAVASVARRVSDRGPALDVSFVDASGAAQVALGRASFAEDAVQLVLPRAVVEGQACFTLRSLRSVHVAEDGARLEDVVDGVAACDAPPGPVVAREGPSGAASTGTATPPQESAYELPSEANVPGPGFALVGAALAVALALAGRGLSRRR